MMLWKAICLPALVQWLFNHQQPTRALKSKYLWNPVHGVRWWHQLSHKSNILFEAPKWTLQKRYHAWYKCGEVRYLTFAAKGWYVESRVFWHDELCFFKRLFGVLLRALFDPMSFLSYALLADQANKGVTFQVAEALSWVGCVEFSKRIVSLGAGQIIFSQVMVSTDSMSNKLQQAPRYTVACSEDSPTDVCFFIFYIFQMIAIYRCACVWNISYA